MIQNVCTLLWEITFLHINIHHQLKQKDGFPHTLKVRTSRVISRMKKSKMASSSIFVSQLTFIQRKWTPIFLEVMYFGPSKGSKTPNYSEKDKYSSVKLHAFFTKDTQRFLDIDFSTGF